MAPGLVPVVKKVDSAIHWINLTNLAPVSQSNSNKKKPWLILMCFLTLPSAVYLV